MGQSLRQRADMPVVARRAVPKPAAASETMTAFHTDACLTVTVFQAILAICRTASERDMVLPVAEQLRAPRSPGPQPPLPVLRPHRRTMELKWRAQNRRTPDYRRVSLIRVVQQLPLHAEVLVALLGLVVAPHPGAVV